MIKYKETEYENDEELFICQLPAVLVYLANQREQSGNAFSKEGYDLLLKKEYGAGCSFDSFLEVFKRDEEFRNRTLEAALQEILHSKNFNIAAKTDPHVRKDVKAGKVLPRTLGGKNGRRVKGLINRKGITNTDVL